MELLVSDHFGRFERIEISEIRIDYHDGRAERISGPFVYPFQRDPGGSGKMGLALDLPAGVIPRHADFKMSCKGKLFRPDGRAAEFSGKKEFKADSMWRLWTGWDWLASESC